MVLELFDKFYEDDILDKLCMEDNQPNCFSIFNGFRIFVDDKNKIEDYMNNPDVFYDLYTKNKSLYDNRRYGKKSVIRNVVNPEYISLDFADIDPIEYIDNSKFLKGKNILLKGRFTIEDSDKLLDNIKKYNKYIDNIYVMFEGDYSFVKIKDAYDTINKIKEKAIEINSLNFSPMEKIMYAYDMVRNRVYNEESKDESGLVSRNLTSVLNGDKIVCVGYAEVFGALLKYMGFNRSIVFLDKKNSVKRHARNSVYVKDDKYGIDGVYYFDTTWDAKKNGTNNFLNRYKYFARTKHQIETLSPSYHKEFEYSFELYKSLEKDVRRFINDETILVPEFHNLIYKKYRDVFNTMSLKYNDERIITKFCSIVLKNINNRDEVVKKCYEFLEEVRKLCIRFGNVIEPNVMLNLFNNVRKVEYYINPNLYPYDLESMKKTAINSEWIFSLSQQEILLCALFGECPKNIDEQFKDIINMYGIDKDIESVHFTKKLQQYVKNIKK